MPISPELTKPVRTPNYREEYKQKFSGKDETPESKLMLANIHQSVDRMIDGYAVRSHPAADTKFTQQKTVWNESLTTWYKYPE